MPKRKPAPKQWPKQWTGDEVEDKSPDGAAEQAAERVEGNTPISVADAVERAGDDEDVELPTPARDALSPEEKIAEVAEEHRARFAAGDRGRGKL